MSLSDWAKNDWLKEHKTTKQEIDGLLSIVGISSEGLGSVLVVFKDKLC